ncbi:NIPSNAP family protein [uncultured Roseobacter sp.]|uniref:NIPSNAP family protein n=1 Tax=uncultured Roseobacter sp. TaxID=114847 RepID=UPI0026193444|nr:NIPSNAP family protein [uncultured Roseobacter sp.]
MINQLRIYTVPTDNRQPFLARFRDHAARIMTAHGFAIQAMWTNETEGDPRFVYLLAWRDEDHMRTCWEAFMADPDWARIKQETAAEHGTFVLGIEDLTLTPTEFSTAIGAMS